MAINSDQQEFCQKDRPETDINFKGVSNFNHVQMERLISEGSIKPSVLQVERNPRFSQVKPSNIFSRSLITFSQNYLNGAKKMMF